MKVCFILLKLKMALAHVRKIMFSGHKFKYLVVNDDIYNLLPKTSQGKGYLLCDKCLGAHYPSLLFCILESFHNCFYIN